jgi:GT2 family glycosyltransferase
MKISIVVASVNRPEEIVELLLCLSRQTKRAAEVILSVVAQKDLPKTLPPWVHVIKGAAGLPVQRNRGIDAVSPDADIVLFFDDDYVPSKDALAGVAALFTAHPDVVSATGLVLQDGVKAGGIPFEAAWKTVIDYEAAPQPAMENIDILWAYGCNMAFRAAAIGELRFDENLVLHGWQEDMDFAARIAKSGRVIKTNAFAGVHRGVNKGRTAGFKLGYSQMVNPAYLVKKGTMTPKKAATLMAKNFLANHLKSLRPEPHVDRFGRMRGNWFGLICILRGRADPTRILHFR